MSEAKDRRTAAQKTGDSGEAAALSYLKHHGFELVAKNYHSRYGEIDIIVKDSEYIVFVEVKTRNQFAVSRPSDFVDSRKQKKIMKTAAVFFSEHEYDLQPRFDVMEVTYQKSTKEIIDIHHLENAFIQTEDYAVF